MPEPLPLAKHMHQDTPRTEPMADARFADGRTREQNVEHNMEVLAADEVLGPAYALCYEAAITQFPELGDVLILSKSEHSTSPGSACSRWAEHNSTGRDIVSINMEPGSIEDALAKLEQRPATKRIFMDYLGIQDPAQLTPTRVMAHIFLHELGHTLDYARLIDGAEAYKKFRERRKQEKANHLPIPGVKVGQLLNPAYQARLLELNPDLFKNLGVSGFSELAAKQEVGYRHMPTEVFADSFAATILRQEEFTLTSSAEL